MVIIVSSLLTQTTLDAIGLAALRCQFNNLSTPTEFALAFEDVFGMERPTMSAIMSTLTIYLPIRKFLPIKVNRDYLNANAKIRSLRRQHIRQRKRELADRKEVSVTDTDLLAVMIREKSGGAHAWTEDEMLNHLSVA
jgi:hypothetical protein